MTKYSAKDRQTMEEKHGQRTIFDQINESLENKEEENKEEVKKTLEDYEHSKFSLDDFSRQDEPYVDMFVGFDLSKEETDNEFVITLNKSEFKNMAEFKEISNCEMAFSQKEGSECYTVLDLYEKRLDVIKMKNRKKAPQSIQAETNAIKELENGGDEGELLETLGTPEPSKKKKSSMKP